MKKIRRILAVMLVLVMSLSILGGCNKKTKQTMFTVMEEAASMTHYSYEINMNLKSSAEGMDNMTIKLTGKTDGEAATMGMKISYLYFTISVDDFITITEDAMYLDIEEIFSALAPVLLGTDYSLEDLEEEFGVELKCVEIPFVEGMISFDKNEDYLKLMNSILEKAFSDVKIESNKGTYTATVEGVEALSKVVDAYLTGLIDNKDAIIDAIKGQNKIDEKTMKDLLNLYMNEIIVAIEKFNADYDMGITDEDIAELRKEAEDEVENAINEADLSDMDSAYDELFDTLEDEKDELVDTIADSDDVNTTLEISDSLTGKEGSRVYECEVTFEAENTDTDEDIKINIKAVMTEDNDISIKAPKSYTSMSDLIYAVLVYTYESGLLDDSILEDSGLDIDIPSTEIETEKESDSSAVSEEEQVYDGSVTLADYWTDNVATIEYDKNVVTVDTEYSDPEYGHLCMAAVDDEWCYMFMTYDAETTVDELYEYCKTCYNDPENYKDVVITDLTTRDNGNITIYEFDIKYTSIAGEYSSYERYFIVQAEKGIIYGTVDMDYDFGKDSTLSYEDFISATFVNVY